MEHIEQNFHILYRSLLFVKLVLPYRYLFSKRSMLDDEFYFYALNSGKRHTTFDVIDTYALFSSLFS